MKFFDNILSWRRLIIISLLLATFIIYPNIVTLPWELKFWSYSGNYSENIFIWVFRYLIFITLCGALLLLNIKKLPQERLTMRLLKNVLVTAVAYGVYVAVSLLRGVHVDCFTGMLMFQFFIACVLGTAIGHLYSLYLEKDRQDKEIERLRLESLQGRCDALTNQIHPHFFFNSLNGLSALVREGDQTRTLKYISNLSGVFRYILQSDRKGVVTLGEELEFIDSFDYLQEVRYADKLEFVIDVPDAKKGLKIPILSMLPVIENVVKHNMIDRENPMKVTISLNGNDELVVSNPIHPKIETPENNGIGLSNLRNRFALLLGTVVRVEAADNEFRVYMPLKTDIA